MAGLSYPFDSGPGSSITEDQWSNLMRDTVGTGVHEPANGTPGPQSEELLVFSLGEPGIVYVWPGQSTIRGFHYHQGTTEVIAVTANSNPTQDRIDAVVLRLDLDTNAITLEVKLGSPADTPVPPAVTSNELLLATYRVRKNASTVLSNEVTDKRVWIGRRVRVADVPEGNEGDIAYSPLSQRWSGLDGFGFSEEFAYLSELNAHANALDPHPQYMTLAESTPAVSTGTLSLDSLVTGGYTWQALTFPGGVRVVHFYFDFFWNGAPANPGQRLATLSTTNLRPSGDKTFTGIQFQSSSNPQLQLIRLRADGTIDAPYFGLQGTNRVICNGTYFAGSGV